MGIVKIADGLHEDLRKASTVMCRSINAQAEFWIKVGMLAEANPTQTYGEIMARQLSEAAVPMPEIAAAC